MSGLHETHLRVVSLRWTTNPNQQIPTQISIPQVLQVDNLSDPSRVRIVNHILSFERMVIPYVINFTEARRAGLVFRRPRLIPHYVPFNGMSDTFYEATSWPAPEIYVWQATDDLVYFARATDGVQVALTSRSLNDIDLALTVTYQPAGAADATIRISAIVAIPIAG
ncbi:MAG: hypothetical protein ACOYBY_12840 [Dermatophilaceae bacterium]